MFAILFKQSPTRESLFTTFKDKKVQSSIASPDYWLNP